MKRPGRSFFSLIFSFLLLLQLSAALHLKVFAQQTPDPVRPNSMARPDAGSIVLPVTVTDKKGAPIDGLDKSAFSVYENKVSQPVTYFAGGDEPVSIGVILDLSGSQGANGSKTVNAIRNAVLHFIEQSRSDNQYFIIPFAARVRLLIDWTRDGKTAAEEFSKYNFAPRSGNTALYDACYLAVEKMRTGRYRKQVVLLVTDGQDNNSQYTFSEVRERLKDTGVMLYAVGIFGGNDPGSSLGMEGQSLLEELSAVSGGRAFFPKGAKEVAEAFDRIALELRHQYLIGFKPTQDKADDKWHQIKIKVTPPLTTAGKKQNLVVRSKEGYYAFKSPRSSKF